MNGKPLILGALLLAWIALIAGGSGLKMAHGLRAGAVATGAPAVLGEEDRGRFLQRTGQSALLVFLHPRCPCSRATLEQLERVGKIAEAESAANTPPSIHLLIVTPPGAEEGWERGDILARARRLDGAVVSLDREGALAQRFSARTSGQVFLYDQSGALQFAGGITPARGQAGDPRQARALWNLIRGESGEMTEAPVFGCPLFHSSDLACSGSGPDHTGLECCSRP